ncbi:MAG: hypothetical protein ACOZCO_17280 [Bacteroidota bacterium]
MKTRSKLVWLFLAFLPGTVFSQQPRTLVMNMHIEQVGITPSAAGTMLKIEAQKTGKFTTIDRTDISSDTLNAIYFETCYNIDCLVKTGKVANADKVLSGSIQNLGNKIAITIKLVDVASGKIEKTEVGEYVQLENEIQSMIMITLNKMLGIESKKETVEYLAFYVNIDPVPATKIRNNGPRMGAMFLGGNAADRLTAPTSEGGYDCARVLTQIGYQFEGSYLSAGGVSALGELLFMVSGLDQQMFIPSITLLNGFRLSKSGWEVAFGPSIRLQKKAKGYYDFENKWHLWNEPTGEVDTLGFPVNNYESIYQIDSRGSVMLGTSWVWAIGKTFRSGYLNIPVNAYYSMSKDSWYVGLSFGFNLKSSAGKK